jgi:hypothetical protein
MSERPPTPRHGDDSLFNIDPWSRQREGEARELFERSHPPKPHVRLIALLLVVGLVASSAFVVLSLLFGG